MIVTVAFVILAIAAIGAIYAVCGLALHLLDSLRELLKRTGLDLVQLYAAANSAKLDVAERESRLELASELGQLQIQKHRFELLGPELGGNER